MWRGCSFSQQNYTKTISSSASTPQEAEEEEERLTKGKKYAAQPRPFQVPDSKRH